MWCSLARTRNEPVVAVEGWGSLECVPEGDAVQILSDLVEFAERNWARACKGTEYSDMTIFSGRFPEVKLTERRSTAKESTKTAFDPRSKGIGKDAKLCYKKAVGFISRLSLVNLLSPLSLSLVSLVVRS